MNNLKNPNSFDPFLDQEESEDSHRYGVKKDFSQNFRQFEDLLESEEALKDDPSFDEPEYIDDPTKNDNSLFGDEPFSDDPFEEKPALQKKPSANQKKAEKDDDTLTVFSVRFYEFSKDEILDGIKFFRTETYSKTSSGK